MKRIGVSLPWDYLADRIITEDAAALQNTYSSPEENLNFLRSLDVTHIELRHRQKNCTSGEMAAVFKRIREFDFSITIHGDILPENEHIPFDSFFPWLDPYREDSRFRNKIIVTLHPVSGSDTQCIEKYNNKTISLIKKLDNTISNEKWPISLALENQRSKPKSLTGTTFDEIETMYKKINGNNLGICWDMGHCVANNRIDENKFPLYPQHSFAASTIHTHIHDIGPDGRTHWLFKENITPLSNYVDLLKKTEYTGVYNLEFSFGRFKNESNAKELLKSSILKLRALLN